MGRQKKSWFCLFNSHRPCLLDTESHAPCTFSLEEKSAFQAMLHEDLFQEVSWELLKLTTLDSAEGLTLTLNTNPGMTGVLLSSSAPSQPYSHKNSGLFLQNCGKHPQNEYASSWDWKMTVNTFVLRVSKEDVRWWRMAFRKVGIV